MLLKFFVRSVLSYKYYGIFPNKRNQKSSYQNSNDSNVNNDSNVTEQFLVGDLMQQKYFS